MKIGVFGAGSVGCHVGGSLAAAGHDVVLLGRPSMAARLAGGIELTDYTGRRTWIESPRITGEAAALADRDVLLVCVKSTDTQTAGEALAPVVPDGALVVSLQNGVSNADTLRRLLPGRRVLAGMVAYNVAQIGERRFHRGTEGSIVIEDGPGAAALAAALGAAVVPTRVSTDIAAVQWGKLLMNLNNALNALSGMPLRAQLSDRGERRRLADSVAEALRVLRRAGIRAAKVGKVHPRLMPHVLRLPDRLFKIVAAGMLKIDAAARTSMADDLARGRPPEVDFLQGEIVRLGRQVGVPTPVNEAVLREIRERVAAGAAPAR